MDQFQVRPDFPWEHSARYQSYGIFRHASNRKWFALIMNVKRTVLHKDGTPDLLDVMNLKIRPQEAEQLHRIPGIYPAYHMNHRLWISVVLDNSLADEAILALIKTSYLLTE
ncbi:MmcQ/YjbR family DNA-binding protein [Acidaminococcus fermentans]|uniref:MmcQ/YjbR family DNA-binding protein n=1 Tax=Acidaminococcus fermentans TaxID=905 RepID=UPI002278713D|nr:MmcQ/YjbR family DNA-binding protein [Acidaminococcus fermentans]